MVKDKKVTEFRDMHSGGSQKLDWSHIYIEAPLEEAKIIFQNRFNRNPSRITCSCCGDDYSISESKDMLQATGYKRGCRYVYKNSKGQIVPDDEGWVRGKGLQEGYTEGYIEEPSNERLSFNKYQSIKDFLASENILYIRDEDIKSSERVGELREEGYVWQD